VRTVQMTMDEELIESVDEAAKSLRTTRSAFTRDALKEALARLHLKKLEAKHKRGYTTQPVAADEFSVWEKEQEWGDT
jgi:metal-responsive CopG/Arc/MetJ family transcriptional regulator